MTIGERISKRRQELGLTVDEVAEQLNKSRATVYRYENGEIEKLPTTVLEPLAKLLRTTPAYLMGWVDDAEAPLSDDTKKQPVSELSETDREALELFRQLGEDDKKLILKAMRGSIK